VDFDLVASYSNTIFKQRFRMTKQTISYICQQVAPILFKKNTNRRKAILLEIRVAIALTRLASSSSLYIIVDNYGIDVSTVHTT